MLASFRRMSKSSIGSFILVLFGLLIAASFAMTDMSGSSFGLGGASRDTLAKVGSLKVTDHDMSQAMERRLGQVRQQNVEADYASIASDFAPLLASLIDQRAIGAFAHENGFMLSKRLIDAEISQIPSIRGLDGKPSEQAYAAFLNQQRMTDGELRQLIGDELMQRTLVTPAMTSARMPVGMATPYASMLLEARQGDVALIPTAAFAAGLKPTDAQIQQYYAGNRDRYTVPEQRVLRLAKIGPEQIANVKATDAEVQAYYRDNAATYASKDLRSIDQVVVPDQKTAGEIAARAKGGATIAAAAAPAGANAAISSAKDQTRQAYASVAGEPVAAAVFSAAQGSVVGPVQSDFGWVVAKVNSVRTEGGKSFEQVRPEIEAKLTADKRKNALADLVGKIEDQLADGANYQEAAQSAGHKVTETPLITASGTSRGDAAFKLPPEMAPALKTGFELAADDEPVIETLPNDAGYVLVAPSRIIPAAPAPLASIRDTVAKDWIAKQAADRARSVAAQIAKAANGKATLAAAMQQAKVALPPARPVAARRIQLSQLGGQVPPPLAMLFTLGQSRARMVADPRGRGFFVVKVNKIVPGNALNQPSMIAEVQKEFSGALSEEYAQQFMSAMRKQVGVKRNEDAIEAAKKRITSAGG
jgi:peptidyl-prolyl cis-trans isomerase D